MESVAPATATATPVMVLEVFDTHGRVLERLRLTGAGATCTVGRDVACDIVLDDVYAAAKHTTLTLRDDGRVVVTDLGSRNPTRIDDERLPGATSGTTASAVVDDATLIVGRSRLRVRTVHSPLPAEKLFRRDLLQRYPTTLALTGLALSLTYVAFDRWMSAPEQLTADTLIAMLAVLAGLGVWIGMWALTTRVSHGAWTLRTHIAIATNAAAIAVWSSWWSGAAAFALQWRWIVIPGIALGLAAVAYALYLHLRKSTHIAARTAAILAAVLPLALSGALWWIELDGNARNVNRIDPGIAIFPPNYRLTASTDLGDYLNRVNSLRSDANRERQKSLAEMPLALPNAQ